MPVNCSALYPREFMLLAQDPSCINTSYKSEDKRFLLLHHAPSMWRLDVHSRPNLLNSSTTVSFSHLEQDGAQNLSCSQVLVLKLLPFVSLTANPPVTFRYPQKPCRGCSTRGPSVLAPVSTLSPFPSDSHHRFNCCHLATATLGHCAFCLVC